MKYFSEKMSGGLKNLFIHRVVTKIAVQLAGSFSVIFIYKTLDNNHFDLISFFTTLALLTIIIYPTIGFFINKIGYKKSVILGSFFRVFLWISFFLTSYYSWKLGLVFAGIGILGLRIFYWVPYHTEFMSLRSKNDHSKIILLMSNIGNIVGIFAPFIAGIILSVYSFDVLFGIGVLFLLLGVYPLKKLDRLENKFEWGYLETFKKTFSGKNKAFSVSTFSEGAQSITSYLWPVFIFEILDGDYLKLGLVTTGTTVFVIVANLFIGKYLDKNKNEKKFIKYGTVLYSVGWIIKIFVTTVGQVFIIDIYHKLSNVIYSGSYTSLMYEYTVDKGHLVDEYTLAREISIRSGQLFTGIIILIGILLLPINLLFVIGAISILFFNLIPDRNRKKNV